MKILFVNYHHLDGNSGIHIFNLANQLSRLGVKCTVCVPNHKEWTVSVGEAHFEIVEFSDVQQRKLDTDFDLIHAWTPREGVRKITQALRGGNPCPYIVHLEDNEEFIIESVSKIPLSLYKYVPNFLSWMILPGTVSHPLRYKEFLAGASGITIIVEALKEFCPPRVPSRVIWAGYQEDLNWYTTPDIEYKRRLGIPENEFLIIYTGNVHLANRQEVSELYGAIEILNTRGIPVKLIRTGNNYSPIIDSTFKVGRTNNVVELGHLPRLNLPSLLSIADILVQPGKPGRFNDFRFPSKLPEYFASGKPVILPKTNIGLHLKDHEECLLLEKGDRYDIAEKIETLLLDTSLRNRIGTGGRLFAEQHLQWGKIAAGLYSFYEKLLGS